MQVDLHIDMMEAFWGFILANCALAILPFLIIGGALVVMFVFTTIASWFEKPRTTPGDGKTPYQRSK